jgi:hypothetical protein
MPTFADILTSARELSFDRFVTPTFFIGGATGYTLNVTSEKLQITHPVGAIPVITPVTTLLFSEYPTLDDILQALMSDAMNYEVSYSASFIGSEPSSSLLPRTGANLSIAVPVYRKYFFSADMVMKLAHMYLEQVIGVRCEDIDVTDDISKFRSHRPQHMSLWIAYWLVDKRRLYELAGEIMGQSTFSFSGKSGMIGVSQDGGTIDVNLGDVFRLNDAPTTKFNEGERPAGFGADNVLGDAYSFWYRLQLYIRRQYEMMFGDNALRPDQIMMGTIDLQKDQNFYAYYDQYPYTISPLSREILGSMEWAH